MNRRGFLQAAVATIALTTGLARVGLSLKREFGLQIDWFGLSLGTQTAIWDCELSDVEIQAFLGGVSPTAIAPGHLIRWLPGHTAEIQSALNDTEIITNYTVIYGPGYTANAEHQQTFS